MRTGDPAMQLPRGWGSRPYQAKVKENAKQSITMGLNGILYYRYKDSHMDANRFIATSTRAINDTNEERDMIQHTVLFHLELPAKEKETHLNNKKALESGTTRGSKALKALEVQNQYQPQ